MAKRILACLAVCAGLLSCRAGHSELKTLRGHTKAVRFLAFSRDGRTLASADGDGTVRLWDVAAGTLKRELRGSTTVRTMGFLDDDTLAEVEESTSDNQGLRPYLLRTFDVGTGAEKPSREIYWGIDPLRRLLAHHANTDELTRLYTFVGSTLDSRAPTSPDAARAAAVLENDVEVLESDGQVRRFSTSLQSGQLSDWRFFWPDNSHVAMVARERNATHVLMFDVEAQRLRWSQKFQRIVDAEMTSRSGRVDSLAKAIAFSPDANTIAVVDSSFRAQKVRSTGFVSSSEHDTIEIRNALAGITNRRMRGHDAVITAMLFSPDGMRLASADARGDIKIWETR